MKFVLPCILVVITDQVSKYAVSRLIPLGRSVRILGDFVRFIYVHNPGAIFSIPVGPYFLYLVGAACIVLLVYSIRKKSALLSLILGGAIGNLIDRIRIGAVVDFVDIGIGNIRWPAFNVADSCITIGVIIFIILKFRRR
jgi:signal peptidase II